MKRKKHFGSSHSKNMSLTNKINVSVRSCKGHVIFIQIIIYHKVLKRKQRICPLKIFLGLRVPNMTSLGLFVLNYIKEELGES